LEKAEPRKGLAGKEVKSNITDNESGFIKSADGYIQGYNAIAIADSANQVIISAKAKGTVAENGCFPEMLKDLEENMKKISSKENPFKKALLTADTGFFSEDNLQEAEKIGIEVIIPDPQFRQRDPYYAEKKREKVEKKLFTVEDFAYNEETDSYICPGRKVLKNIGDTLLGNSGGRKYQARGKDCAACPFLDLCIRKRKSKMPTKKKDTRKKQKHRYPARTLFIAEKKNKENLCEKMRDKIDDPVYRELYSRRMQIIEPVFSNIKYCKGMDRFTLRSEKKVNIQWQLYCIVHNIGKCMNAINTKRRKSA